MPPLTRRRGEVRSRGRVVVGEVGTGEKEVADDLLWIPAGLRRPDDQVAAARTTAGSAAWTRRTSSELHNSTFRDCRAASHQGDSQRPGPRPRDTQRSAGPEPA